MSDVFFKGQMNPALRRTEVLNPISLLAAEGNARYDSTSDSFDYRYDLPEGKELERVRRIEREALESIEKEFGSAMDLELLLEKARKAEGSVDYYPELRNLLNSDVVIQSARNPRRERLAGQAIAAALGFGGGAAAVAGYNTLNNGEQY